MKGCLEKRGGEFWRLLEEGRDGMWTNHEAVGSVLVGHHNCFLNGSQEEEEKANGWKSCAGGGVVWG